tara:strand:+ start:1854 stop:2975 length:1122 start_codon:yes stop_codon:yes gene_type:complete
MNMELEYNFLNMLVLFGGLQGLMLCFFLYQKRQINRLAVDFFLLFLFSLSFFNLIYAALDMNVFAYHRPLHMFPFPYKWLIGIGFFFYIKNQFRPKDSIPYHKKYWFLFIPAIAYFFLRLYWFSIAVRENSYRITQVVVDSEFFRIHEFILQIFTAILLIHILKTLRKQSQLFLSNTKILKHIHSLQKITKVFLGIVVLSVLIYLTDIIIHQGNETFAFLYPQLLMQMAFIYWIGFLGFTKPKSFFLPLPDIKKKVHPRDDALAAKLLKAMEHGEVFKNANLNLSQLALDLDASSKELSRHINEVHQMNFSEYLNKYRVENVKKLLASKDAQKYTLVTLAETAGFSSKSSFNAIFKKTTGLTPSAYKKQISTS